jgi:hypothetical protein
MSAVRRSCQTMAGASGAPVRRSQNTAVSRWLAMPMQEIIDGLIRDSAMASRAVASCDDHISIGSCSTHPGRG